MHRTVPTKRQSIILWTLLGLMLFLVTPPARSEQPTPPAFMQVEVSPNDGSTYVQQQILYTARLFYRISILGGDFIPPSSADAIIEKLGSKRQYRATLGGQKYQVVEQRYAIFPERSGTLSLSPVQFTGVTALTGQARLHSREKAAIRQMLKRSGTNSQIVARDISTPVDMTSDTVWLSIKPRPEHYSGVDWLPGQTLELQDSWSGSAPTLQAGEPLVRTLTLEAQGLEASQLPEIHLSESNRLRIYPEQAELSNWDDDEWIYGSRIQNFTYVATRGGTFIVPEIRVDWWDNVNHKQQHVILPAIEIEVLAAANEAVMAADLMESANVNTSASGEAARQGGLFWWVSVGLLLLALSAALWQWLRRRPVPSIVKNKPSATIQFTVPEARTLARNALQTACEQNDPHQAAAALLQWAVVVWPNNQPLGLGALAMLVDKGQRSIRELENALYSAGQQSWRGEALWNVFVDGLQSPVETRHRKSADPVPALYPDWGHSKG